MSTDDKNIPTVDWTSLNISLERLGTDIRALKGENGTLRKKLSDTELKLLNESAHHVETDNALSKANFDNKKLTNELAEANRLLASDRARHDALHLAKKHAGSDLGIYFNDVQPGSDDVRISLRLIEAIRHEARNEMLGSVLRSLRDYPDTVGDIQIMTEVKKLLQKQRVGIVNRLQEYRNGVGQLSQFDVITNCISRVNED